MQKNPGEVSSALAFIAKDRSSHPMGSDKPLVLPFWMQNRRIMVLHLTSNPSCASYQLERMRLGVEHIVV
jgi:hypothetical protein